MPRPYRIKLAVDAFAYIEADVSPAAANEAVAAVKKIVAQDREAQRVVDPRKFLAPRLFPDGLPKNSRVEGWSV